MKTAQTILHVGLDVHKESIAVALAGSDGSPLRYGTIAGHLQAMDKLINKLQKPGQELRFCHEAGPFGFVLCRHLRRQGYLCEVVAPSLIPKRAGDRIKTDYRDAEQLARLFRAGELTPVRVPDESDEAVRQIAWKAQQRLYARQRSSNGNRPRRRPRAHKKRRPT